jgi:hypothetical protein
MRVVLKKNFFVEKEKLFLETEDLKVSLYKYETGIEALRIQNDLGYIIVLPFKGQMVWEAMFNGRLLNMSRVGKYQPKPADHYLFGAFGTYFFHCGALRMGVPGEGDDHPVHGELPYADYDEAELVVGTDEKGTYVGIGGVFRYNRGFGACYEAHPLTKVYSRSSLMDISLRIDNLSDYPMELMYMAHLNCRPVDNARFVQCHAWTPQDMPLYVPKNFEMPDDFRQMADKIRANPKLTEALTPGVVYKPEVTFYLNAPRVDEDGWTHFMQVLPDGTADVLRYKPSELNHALRWLCRTGDQDAISLAFPSTANVEGYNIEKKSGRVRELPPKGSFSMSLTAGCLNKEDAAKEEALIQRIMA